MKEVKMPTSDSYLDALIEELKDPEMGAGSIEVALELEEKDPQPDILRLTLKDVVEARVRLNNLSEEAKRSYEKLDKILLETGASEIYSLVELLDGLGFRIAIASKAEEIPDDKKLYSLEFLFDATQLNLAELKDEVEKALQNYLTDINLKVEQADSGALRVLIAGPLKVIDACHNKINEILLNQFHLNFVRLLDEAGDEIRQRAYPILAEIEQRFRVFVSQALVEVCGFDWWETLAPANMQSKVQPILDKQQKSGTALDPLEGTQFDDLVTLINAKVSKWSNDKLLSVSELLELLSNCGSIDEFRDRLEEKVKEFSYWDVFARYFQDDKQWKDLQKYINFVINERHKVMHHRPIRLGVIKALSDKKEEIFSLLDSTKHELSEQERTEAQQDIREIRETISAQVNALRNPSQLDRMRALVGDPLKQQQAQLDQMRALVGDPLKQQQSQLDQIRALVGDPLKQQQSQLDQIRALVGDPLKQQNVDSSKAEDQMSETNLDPDAKPETDVNSNSDNLNDNP